MSNSKKKAKELSKIEVENIRLSQDRKDSIVARFCDQKFNTLESKNQIALSAECAKWHKETYPEMDYITKKIGLNWFASTKRFSFKRNSERYRIDAIDRFIIPINSSNYDGHYMEKPSKKLLELFAEYEAIRNNREVFRSDFNRLISAVTTSKQLCELVPECAILFPKKGGKAGCSLVPIELVRKVRASLEVSK